jgi:hypothetical protein
MSRDASSSATINRSYLRQQRIVNESLKSASIDRKVNVFQNRQCYDYSSMILLNVRQCITLESFGLSTTRINKLFISLISLVAARG